MLFGQPVQKRNINDARDEEHHDESHQDHDQPGLKELLGLLPSNQAAST